MKDDLPKISIVMPCFNSVDYIERSIRSVVEQEYPNIELYIKDGGSEDGTINIIKHYVQRFPHIIKWESTKDRGQTDAINIGMKKINGDILTYLNADDIYKPGALNIIAEYFVNHPEIMWAYGKADIIDGDDRSTRKWITFYKNFWLRNYSYNSLLVLNYISQMACFWRKEAAKKVGEFDTSQHYVMDYDYWLRLGEYDNAGVINKYLASFRIVNTTKSSTGFVKQFKDELIAARKHTNSSIILFLHQLHIMIIIFIYSVLKFIHSFLGNNYKQMAKI
jgi:glycosyltransferase involved in cell wall biosynthesis